MEQDATQTPGAADAAVAAFLEQRDVPCPGCGYNLRGCAAAACPECGRALRLRLDPGDRGALPHRMFLVLALGWVLIASAMNTVRAVQTLRFELSMVQRQRLALTTIQSFSAGQGRVTIRLAPGGALAPAATVSNSTWARLVWAGGLTVGAAAGFVALGLVRRAARLEDADGRGDGPPRGRRLVAYAWGLFAVYAGWHIVMFVREIGGL